MHSKYYGYTGDKCSYHHLSKELLFLSVYLDHNRKPDLDAEQRSMDPEKLGPSESQLCIDGSGNIIQGAGERATTPESFL